MKKQCELTREDVVTVSDAFAAGHKQLWLWLASSMEHDKSKWPGWDACFGYGNAELSGGTVALLPVTHGALLTLASTNCFACAMRKFLYHASLHITELGNYEQVSAGEHCAMCPLVTAAREMTAEQLVGDGLGTSRTCLTGLFDTWQCETDTLKKSAVAEIIANLTWQLPSF